jgi:predicted RNA-binding protein with PUA-like domain
MRAAIVFFKLEISTPISRHSSSRAQRSGVEGSRRKTQSTATGFLDFARNDNDDARSTYLGMKNFWLVKQEPSSYSWSDFVAEGQTSWTGVRNYTARNNLRRMEKNDEVLFYHSGEDKAVVGIAKVIRTAYPDSTAKEGDWSAIDLVPVKPLRRPVTLREIKSHSPLKGIPLVRQSRLSVMPLAESEFREIVKMASK